MCEMMAALIVYHIPGSTQMSFRPITFGVFTLIFKIYFAPPSLWVHTFCSTYDWSDTHKPNHRTDAYT